jgi:hypothetical protein
MAIFPVPTLPAKDIDKAWKEETQIQNFSHQ